MLYNRQDTGINILRKNYLLLKIIYYYLLLNY